MIGRRGLRRTIALNMLQMSKLPGWVVRWAATASSPSSPPSTPSRKFSEVASPYRSAHVGPSCPRRLGLRHRHRKLRPRCSQRGWYWRNYQNLSRWSLRVIWWMIGMILSWQATVRKVVGEVAKVACIRLLLLSFYSNQPQYSRRHHPNLRLLLSFHCYRYYRLHHCCRH